MKIERIIFPDGNDKFRYVQVKGKFYKGYPKRRKRSFNIPSLLTNQNIVVENDVELYELTNQDWSFLKSKQVDDRFL